MKKGTGRFLTKWTRRAFFMLVAFFLGYFGGKFADVFVVFDNAAGWYDPLFHTMTVRSEYKGVSLDWRRMEDVFYHEMGHAVWFEYLNESDRETYELLVDSYMENRKDAIEFLKKTTKHGKPKFIQTDAAKFYPRAMRKLFGLPAVKGKMTISGMKPMSVEHRITNVSKTGKHNVRIETVFSKIKDRVDDFRGLKALWSAPILMQGIILQHNYIEAHTTTGKIPSELAGLKTATADNRWLELIKLAIIGKF